VDNEFYQGQKYKEPDNPELHHTLAKLAEERRKGKRRDVYDESAHGATLLGSANGGSREEVGGSTLLGSPQNTSVHAGVCIRDFTFPAGTEGEPAADGGW